ncbi:LamG-like jellyroll fold domain-containing protein [Streptacidiphilus albus]|uniref:LamG-like jellyroll fold domain-containing protein n=1 Tax=Streptacidiphilus albus TaxID=105425 RepID=UPI001E408346|nr:LamG-like jellyroll fold domain-containing protein [Streptacidiphilus albus]
MMKRQRAGAAHHQGRRSLAVLVVLGVSAVGLAPAYASVPATSHVLNASGSAEPPARTTASDRALNPVPSGFGITALDQLRMQQAAAQARTTGRAVTVDALTTPTEAVLAEPSGKFMLSANPLPVRVARAGGWVPVDLDLARNSDGMWAPGATAYGTVEFSAGGNGPLAVTRSAGTSLTLTWPTTLPAPSVEGQTATYRSVLPGVDLQVSATADGGLSDVLVIYSAQAAADPALKSIRLGTVVRGGRLAPAPDGGLEVTDASGSVVADGATPMQWDSNAVLPASPHTPRGAEVAADASSAGQPGLAARLARVDTRVTSDSVSLVPDAGMLSARSTIWPVYVDPSVNWHPISYGSPMFDEVKQGCAGNSFVNSTSSLADSGYLGVGYNGWQEGECNTGDEHAVYQWNLSKTIWGADINSATVNTLDYYSASCSASATVNLHWSKGMGSGTDWSNRPGYNSYSISQSVGPSYNPQNCPSQSQPAAGFDVLTPIRAEAKAHSTTFTVTLSEDSDESSWNDLGFKRFTNNPTLQIFYNNPPNPPTASTMSAAAGADDAACSTSAPGPYMGKTIESTPPSLTAKVTDPNGDKLQATFQYWINGTTTLHTATSADNLASGTYATVALPSTFVASLTTSQTVDWNVMISDGMDPTTYAQSPICHFTVEPAAPTQPTITSVNNANPDTDVPNAAVGAPAGTPGSFSITGNGTTATTFIYRLDQPPATSNPPASQTVAASGNAATITVTPPSPGPHTLYVYSMDAAGDLSAEQSYPFLAAGHAASTCTSLAACYNNTAISPDSNMSEGAADGTNSFSATDLANAGWNSANWVTVDGASIKLPAFGSGQADNVMAANQTVGFTGSGNALVFLATSTNSTTTVTGAIAGDTTAPYVPANTPFAGSYCFSGTNPMNWCAPTGTITYTNGTSSTYTLTVPDWVSGPASLAAVSLPHSNTPTGQKTQAVKLYPFAVPITPGLTIASVTLPDVSQSVNGGQQALHIFAMATRNTTAGTPEANGTYATPPTGQSWTGAWGNPNEGNYNLLGGSNFSDQTFRIALKPSISGTTVRVKLDNSLGTSTLDIAHATIALSSTPNTIGAVPAATPTTLTFGGSPSTVVPQGGMVYSDPLPFTVTAGQYLLVSYQLSNSVPYLVQHSYANGSYEYITSTGSGDLTTSTSTTPFTTNAAAYGNFTDLVTDLDVQSANVPTEAVLGDNLIDPLQSGTTLPNSNGDRVSDALSGAEPSTAQPFGVLAEGIESNDLMTDNPETFDGSAVGGPSALSRIDRDVLDQPGIKTVIVSEGLEDLLAGDSNTDLQTNGYLALVQQLQGWGITVVLTSLTPCDGFTGDGATPNDPCTLSTVDANRMDVNAYLGGMNLGNPWSTPAVYFADYDAAVAVPDTSNPGVEKLAPGADGGDHANLSVAAFGALANTLLSPQDTWDLNDGNTSTAVTVAQDTAATDDGNQILTPNAITNTNTGNNPLTLSATGATWTNDATRGESLAFDGTTGYAASANTGVINTTGSYTVSAWAKLNTGFSTTGYYTAVGQRDATGVRCGFYLQYSAAYKGWALVVPSTDSAGAPAYYHASSTAAVTAGTWYHLVGTYSAATGTMSLYVNGTLVGTGTDTTPWAANGPLLIGGADGGNTPGTVADFPGSISNVQAFNYALAPNQVTALYQQIQ